MKNPEKVFCFKDNGAWTCCVKVCILRREYVYSAVNVLTNSPNILDLTKDKSSASADLSSVSYWLTGWLPKAVLK